MVYWKPCAVKYGQYKFSKMLISVGMPLPGIVGLVPVIVKHKLVTDHSQSLQRIKSGFRFLYIFVIVLLSS